MRQVLLVCAVVLGLCSQAMSPIFGQEGQTTALGVAQTHTNAVFSYIIDRGQNERGEAIWSKGTAFLISNDPPVLVTVAHLMHFVTDVSKLTVRDNISGEARPVKSVFLHPEYSTNQGSKNPYTADVAVILLFEPVPESFQRLRLHEGDTSKLQGEAIVSFGFPKYAAFEEEKGGTAEAVIRQGIIQRTVDFDAVSTASPLHERPLLEISTPCIDGESGCPIILLSTGEVVGVQVGERTYKYTGTQIPGLIIPLAVHVKYLRDLLEKEGLMIAP